MTRPSWDLFFMRHAYVNASRGSCVRRQVGAVIVRDRDKRIISGGYNGAPKDQPHCLDVGCKLTTNAEGKQNCIRTLHAESNAIDGALMSLSIEPHTMYCTTIPCYPCALRIVQSGIRTMVFHEYYESVATKDVEALFAGGPIKCGWDARCDQPIARIDWWRHLAEVHGATGRSDIAEPVVYLHKLDVPMDLVRATYGEPKL
jgi:dCMP deaminase